MNKKKSIILTVIAGITLISLIIGATYAYFQATGGVGTSTDVKVTTYTSDLLTFEVGKDIAIYADQSNFAEDTGNQSGASFAKATLSANSKTNTAKDNYYVYLYIADNNFTYTQEDNTPELLLQVTNPSGNLVKSLNGLEYKTVKDGKGQTIKGFDITTKSGMLTLVDNHEINATPKTEETWNINVVFVNLDANQNKNTGKSFNGQIIITKENYDDYTPAMVHTISTSVEDSNLTVEVNASEGTSGIDKYYFALKETNAVAMDTSKVTRLSNKLAVNNLEYFESDKNSYTFTNINSSSNYEIYTYVVDNKKMVSNTYNSKINPSVVLPSITNVEVTNKTSTSLTVSVTAKSETNALNKYYYSIDNGNNYVEFTSSTYTFTNLIYSTKYNIKVKVSDISNNYSYEYGISENTLSPTMGDVCKNNQTLDSCVRSMYGKDDTLYYHNSNLANGANDYSYRYAGASDSVNNFVCFGSDATTCPDDNLYRIIGVISGVVKLIKWDYANSNLLGTDGTYNSNTYSKNKISTYKGSLSKINLYYWSLYNYNTWEKSELRSVNLNNNFLNNIGDDWANKILYTSWAIGGTSMDKLIYSNAYTAFKNETPIDTYFYNYMNKVGLMYVSDYYYSASPTYWLYPGYDSSSMNDYRVTINDNWMYMGLNEWTITRNNDDTIGLFLLVSNGYSAIATYDVYLAIRPAFYLTASIKYISGDGTKNSPIRID